MNKVIANKEIKKIIFYLFFLLLLKYYIYYQYFIFEFIFDLSPFDIDSCLKRNKYTRLNNITYCN